MPSPSASPARSRSLRALAAAAAVALLGTGVLTGCTTAQEAETNANASLGTTTCPVTTNDDVTGTVRIGYQAVPNANLLVKNQRWLENCFPHATISWLKFDSGADVVQAFGSGSVDLATLGSSPATKALSAPLNIDLQVVWIDDIIGKAESLVVRESGVTSIQQLKGKTIATPFGSTSHYSLLQALSAAGLSSTDVKLVNLAPDKMMAAWQGNQIDAAWVWDPVLSQLTKTGHIITGSDATAASGHPTFDLEGATTSFIQSHASFMNTWTSVEDYAVGQLAAHPDTAAQSIAVELGSTTDSVTTQLKGYMYPTAKQQVSLVKKLPSQLLATAQFLKTQQGVDAVGSLNAYTAGVYTTAITKVAS